VQVRTLIVTVSLLAACGYDAEQGQDHGDVPDNVAAVLDHELAYRTLWISEDGGPEQAAEEFLEHVLGWSTDPERPPMSDPRMEASVDDPDATVPRRASVGAESPDGHIVGLDVRRGGPTPPGVRPDGPADHRWRIRGAATQGHWLSLDGDADRLGVHLIPDEQDQSVLLLYVAGETASFLLDDGELEPGAQADDVDLSSLGVDGEDPVTTGLVVHFDDDGRVLSFGGGDFHRDPRVPRPPPDRGPLREVEPQEP
jgi:hypothetical protein